MEIRTTLPYCKEDTREESENDGYRFFTKHAVVYAFSGKLQGDTLEKANEEVEKNAVLDSSRSRKLVSWPYPS